MDYLGYGGGVWDGILKKVGNFYLILRLWIIWSSVSGGFFCHGLRVCPRMFVFVNLRRMM